MSPRRLGIPDRELDTDTRHSRIRWDGQQTARVPGLSILYHPDPSRIGERAVLLDSTARRPVLLSRLEPAFAAPGSGDLRPLGSRHLSRRPVCLELTDGGRTVHLDCRQAGTSVAIGGRWIAGRKTLTAPDLERGVVLVLAERIVLLLSLVDPAPPVGVPDYGLVGMSAAMLDLRQQIQRVHDLDVPVLLRGETGSGKELVARAIYAWGHRREGPFLSLNMAGIPPSLAAAELFGVAKGAFTGADRRRDGYFARAAGGTLFLDEVGEMPLEVQGLLLRALESGEIQPVGDAATRRVDVRLIAATDADLEAATAAGDFRGPLLHRLAGYQIRLPPLRVRRDDFGRLLIHFLRQELAAVGEQDRLTEDAGSEPWLPAPLVAQLAEHDWPGNVRQLRNVARELVIAGRGARQIRIGPQVEALLASSPEGAPPPAPAPAPAPAATAGRYRRPSEISETVLLAALRRHRWRLKPAAAELGVARGSLYDRVRKSPVARTAADVSRSEIEVCLERCAGDLEAMVDELRVSREGILRRLRQLGLR